MDTRRGLHDEKGNHRPPALKAERRHHEESRAQDKQLRTALGCDCLDRADGWGQRRPLSRGSDLLLPVIANKAIGRNLGHGMCVAARLRLRHNYYCRHALA